MKFSIIYIGSFANKFSDGFRGVTVANRVFSTYSDNMKYSSKFISYKAFLKFNSIYLTNY